MRVNTKIISCAAILIALGVGLSSCVTDEEQRGRDLALDRNRCSGLGFQPGSQALAQCMDTASANRAADQDRQAAAWRQDQARQARAQADADADRRARQADADAKRQADIDAWGRQRQRDRDAIMPTQPPAPDAGPLPSAARIPGMQCSGTGDDASCDAR
jgi:hypothetical protein